MQAHKEPVSQSHQWLRAVLELLALILVAPLVLLTLFAPAELQQLIIHLFVPAGDTTIVPDRGALSLNRAAIIFGLACFVLCALLRLFDGLQVPASAPTLRRWEWACRLLIAICLVGFILTLRPHYQVTDGKLRTLTTFGQHEVDLRDVTAARITLSPPGGGGHRRLLPSDIRRRLVLRSGTSEEVIYGMKPADIAAIIAALPAGLPCTIEASEISRSRRGSYIAEVQRAIHSKTGSAYCTSTGSGPDRK